MKKIIIAALMSLCAGCFSASAADFKLAVVDSQKILRNVPQVRTLDVTFKSQFVPREVQLKKDADQLNIDMANLKKISSTLTPEQKETAQQKIDKQQHDLQNAQAQFAQDLQTAQANAMKNVLTQIKTAVSEIAQANGYDMVLPQSSTIYYKANADITQQVIAKLK